MGKATKAVWCGIWLLCALTLIASLDGIPDPPAVKSGTNDVKAVAVSNPLQGLAGGEPRSNSMVPGPGTATRWTALRQIFEARIPIAEVAQVRQAADPSPPAILPAEL